MLVAEDEERRRRGADAAGARRPRERRGISRGRHPRLGRGGAAARADRADRRGRARGAPRRGSATSRSSTCAGPAEWQAGHIAAGGPHAAARARGARPTLDRERPVAAICAGGYRSSIATSVLERLGFRKVINVVGGMAAWNGAKYEVGTRRAGGRMQEAWSLRRRSDRARSARPRGRPAQEPKAGQRLGVEEVGLGAARPPAQKDEVFRSPRTTRATSTVARSAQTSTREVLRLAKAAGLLGVHRRRRRSSRARGSSSTGTTARSSSSSSAPSRSSRARALVGTHHDSPHIDLKARPIYAAERLHALQDDLLRRHQEVPVGQPPARPDRPHRHGRRQARRRLDRPEGRRSRLRDPRQRAALGQARCATASTRTSSRARSSIPSPAASRGRTPRSPRRSSRR